MPNRRVSQLRAKLEGGSVGETFDIVSKPSGTLVIFADSYGTYTIQEATPFTELIKTMGVYDMFADYTYAARGGSGFSTYFENQIQDLVSTVTGIDDNDVTTVLCVSGTNDAKAAGTSYATQQQVVDGITLWATRVKAKFPNVKKIMMAYDAHVCADQYSYPNMKLSYNYYSAACKSNELELINCVNFAEPIKSYYQTDGIHPNLAGCKALARAVMTILEGGRSIQSGYVGLDIGTNGVSGSMRCGPYLNSIDLNINISLTSFPTSNFARIKNITFSEDRYFLATTTDSTLVYKKAFVKLGKDGYLSELSTGGGNPSASHGLKLYTNFTVPNYEVGTNKSAHFNV